LPPELKAPYFPYLAGFPISSVEFEITGYYDPGRLQHAGNKDYPVMRRFPLFVTLRDHNSPTLQTDGQTDVMLVAQTECDLSGHFKMHLSGHEGRNTALTDTEMHCYI